MVVLKRLIMLVLLLTTLVGCTEDQFIEITPQYLLSELLKLLLKALLNVKVHNAFHFALK